ncbi:MULTISPECIES: hypothetical protein [unclassified Burkholderia]|uniref:immunity protein Imm33 domain-containing protein n=1 Tax=unclassified Burkholderia TaxID=2613784 RepID=UPI002AB18088|nr:MULTISPECIES: hypothetical protein [unclassified Burkholderia]
MSNLTETQREVCERFNAPFFGCDMNLKVGISRNVKEGIRPLNGLRLEPDSTTCGWYIWAGEEFSESPDFFVPLHALHLSDWAPLVIPYLGLPPGWRFLITEEYEDVWEDSDLLKD